MAEQAKNGPGTQPSPGQAPIQARVVGQYIKDLSFENPNVGRLLQGPGDNPNLKIEVNVNAKRMANDLFESAIDFKAHATNNAGVIYDLEMVYAGLFKVENMPEQALEPFLLINCPALLFPFLRRLAADLTREGGFPPLLLDPIDFAGLYMRRQQQASGTPAGGQVPKA
jgi:preprotein translocase subunit SecB